MAKKDEVEYRLRNVTWSDRTDPVVVERYRRVVAEVLYEEMKEIEEAKAKKKKEKRGKD